LLHNAPGGHGRHVIEGKRLRKKSEKVIDRARVLLGMLALIGCLLAASTLHTHEPGLYDVGHTCVSCDLEELNAHGALPAMAPRLPDSFNAEKPCTVCRSVNLFAIQQSSIRGPPHHT